MTAETATKDQALIITKRLPASPERVFAAWTNAASLQKWLCPFDIRRTEATLDLRVGGQYHIAMHGDEGVYDHIGEYREISPPHRLVFTWSSPGTGGQETLVTVELASVGDSETELTLTHEGFTDDGMAERHNGGWSSALEKLVAALSG